MSAEWTGECVWDMITTTLQWCHCCGTLKGGPYSEHGSYRYYVYHSPGHDPIDAKVDPPCKKTILDRLTEI
ncbi:MAG: hypothetical protein AB7L09_00805 [Nitrospira sp.]